MKRCTGTCTTIWKMRVAHWPRTGSATTGLACFGVSQTVVPVNVYFDGLSMLSPKWQELPVPPERNMLDMTRELAISVTIDNREISLATSMETQLKWIKSSFAK